MYTVVLYKCLYSRFTCVTKHRTEFTDMVNFKKFVILHVWINEFYVYIVYERFMNETIFSRFR